MDKANTHVAVHSIQYHDDKKNLRTINAKSEFVAKDNLTDEDIKALEASGAIRKLDRKKAAADADATAEADKTGKGGQAAGGTSHATVK